jgi:CRP-like cAMP-binding protein
MPEDPKAAHAAAIKMFCATLRGVDFLYHLKAHEVDLLISVMKKRKYTAGETVIKQGDKGNEFFIVASGKLSVWLKKGFKSPVQIGTCWPEQYFGEMALVDKSPRMATLKAEVPTEVYVLNKVDFDRILMANPAIASGIRKVMQERKSRSVI